MQLISSLDNPNIISFGEAVKKKRVSIFLLCVFALVVVGLIFWIVKYLSKNPKMVQTSLEDVQRRVTAFMNPDGVQNKPLNDTKQTDNNPNDTKLI